MTNLPSDLAVKPIITSSTSVVSTTASSNETQGLFETHEVEVTTSITS